MPAQAQQAHTTLTGGQGTLLDLYIADLRGQNVELLTQQEEQELAGRARAGDREAFEHLVKANLRLVVSLARKCGRGVGSGVPMVELIGEGNLALMAAARRFDPSRNVRFSTYATPWVAHAMSHRIRKEGVPLGCNKSGVPPSRGRGGSALGSATENPGTPLQMVRLEASPEGEDGHLTLRHVLLVDPSPLPDEEAQRRILSAQVRDNMDAVLTARERTLIRQRYGIDGGGGCSFSEAGESLGISRQRAHQIEVGAIDKLRQLPEIERLRDGVVSSAMR